MVFDHATFSKCPPAFQTDCGTRRGRCNKHMQGRVAGEAARVVILFAGSSITLPPSLPGRHCYVVNRKLLICVAVLALEYVRAQLVNCRRTCG